MVKARQLWFVGLFVLGSAACADSQKAPETMIPVAKSIIIYSAGGSVVSGVIEPAAAGARRLPPPAPVQAINLSQSDQSLKWFPVQAVQETRKDATDGQKDGHKLIGLPPLKPGELKFNYALPDITWTLQLKAEIVDAKSVSLRLLAVVNMNASEPYENCDVTLVLNNAVSVEKLSGFTFKLGPFDLYPHRNIDR